MPVSWRLSILSLLLLFCLPPLAFFSPITLISSRISLPLPCARCGFKTGEPSGAKLRKPAPNWSAGSQRGGALNQLPPRCMSLSPPPGVCTRVPREGKRKRRPLLACVFLCSRVVLPYLRLTLKLVSSHFFSQSLFWWDGRGLYMMSPPLLCQQVQHAHDPGDDTLGAAASADAAPLQQHPAELPESIRYQPPTSPPPPARRRTGSPQMSPTSCQR